MSRVMVPAAAVAAAAAIVTAGCASAGASGPGSLDGAAAIVPANAVAFVAREHRSRLVASGTASASRC